MNAIQYSAFEDELEKIAVTLADLRRATAHLKPIRGRRIDTRTGFVHGKATGMHVTPAFTLKKPSPKKMEHIKTLIETTSRAQNPTLRPIFHRAAAEAGVKKLKANLKHLTQGTYQSGSSYKSFYKTFNDLKKKYPKETRGVLPRMPYLKKPQSREMFNRSVMLHEVAELGKQPGRYRFLSHDSLKPPLQDLNIAATLTGTGGKEAATAIRRSRWPDMKLLYQEFPQLKRLRLGKQRLSRHAIKRIQEIFDRKASADLAAAGKTLPQAAAAQRTAPSGQQFSLAIRGPSLSKELAKPAVERWVRKQKLAPLPKGASMLDRLRAAGGAKGKGWERLKQVQTALSGAKEKGVRELALQQRQRQLLKWLKSRWALSNADALEVMKSWSKYLG
jgi:hypothetical protein